MQEHHPFERPGTDATPRPRPDMAGGVSAQTEVPEDKKGTADGEDFRKSADSSSRLISGQNLAGRTLTGLSFAGFTLEKCDFSGSDLTGCDFTGASIQDCSFAGAKLTDALFDEAFCRETSFKDANLRQTSFVRTRCVHVFLDGADLERALFEHTVFEDMPTVSACLHQATLIGLASVPSFHHGNLSQMQCLDCDFTGVHCLHVQAQELVLQNCRGRNMVFEGCDLTLLAATQGDYAGATFLNSICSLAAFSGSDLTNANFTGSLLDLSHFDGSILKNAHLTGVTLTKASFARADLRACDLEGADLSMADLSHALLEHARFDRAKLSLANCHGADLDLASTKEADLTGIRRTDAARLRAEKFQAQVCTNGGDHGLR
ncbi:MAG: pentapeptide repeat-containing protein [Desulfovibrio sp.]|nr:pentapeptide repeat-containing protein [Desulfovibrio sp.]